MTLSDQINGRVPTIYRIVEFNILSKNWGRVEAFCHLSRRRQTNSCVNNLVLYLGVKFNIRNRNDLLSNATCDRLVRIVSSMSKFKECCTQHFDIVVFNIMDGSKLKQWKFKSRVSFS